MKNYFLSYFSCLAKRASVLTSSLIIFSFILINGLALFSQLSVADQYKYKDANGHWRFTDTPPGGAKNVERIAKDKSDDIAGSTDLNAQLLKKYHPDTVIASSTLAVVTIKTGVGTGSGFFISESGYLITNKHVVRPSKQSIAETRREFEVQKKQLDQQQRKLSSQRKRLKSTKENLDRREKELEYFSGDEKELRQKEFARSRRQYLDSKKYVSQNRKTLSANFRKYRSRWDTFNRKTAHAAVANRFTVYLKDKTKLELSLVELSKTHDLALLKLNGYVTPYIKINEVMDLRQGEDIFAIGSPLGLHDYVTAGVVTSIKSDKIIFDAQILPGNSGGPLVNAKGILLGVNTQRLSRSRSLDAQGFGIAIPFSVMHREFSSAFGHKNPIIQSKRVQQNVESNPLLESIMNDFRNGGDEIE